MPELCQGERKQRNACPLVHAVEVGVVYKIIFSQALGCTWLEISTPCVRIIIHVLLLSIPYPPFRLAL